MVIFNMDVPRKFPRPKQVVDSLDRSEVKRLEEAEAEQSKQDICIGPVSYIRISLCYFYFRCLTSFVVYKYIID